MTTGDAVFPIPEPTFLFIHDFTIHNTSGSPTLDDEGRVTTQVYSDLDARGYITFPNPAKDDSAGTVRRVISAVAIVPNGTNVSPEGQLTCADSSVPSVLQGRYNIEEVRPNLSHTRLLLVRIDEPWTYP